MSKSKEELNKLKEEVEAVNEKCRELTPEELKDVTGGATGPNVAGIISSAAAAGTSMAIFG